jgi:hypothetical protein
MSDRQLESDALGRQHTMEFSPWKSFGTGTDLNAAPLAT